MPKPSFGVSYCSTMQQTFKNVAPSLNLNSSAIIMRTKVIILINSLLKTIVSF
jgi:hypothetical protein